MKKGITILGINGSPHKNGLCVKLLKSALAQSRREGANIKIIHLKDQHLPFYHGKYTTSIPKKIIPLFEAIKQAQGLVFATPVHWFNISTLMKNFIDYLTILEMRGFELEGKVASFIATYQEDGGQKAILDMVGPLNHMGFIIPPYAMFFYNKTIAPKSELKWMQKESKLIGSHIVKMINATKINANPCWDYSDLK